MDNESLWKRYREATRECNETVGTDAYHGACQRQHALWEEIQLEGEIALGWTGRVSRNESSGRWIEPTGEYLAGWTLGD